MSRSILFILCLIFLVASVSGYGAYVNCPDQVMIGKALKCSVDSDFPAGTTFDLIFSDPDRKSVV